jgi:hypothetical protein
MIPHRTPRLEGAETIVCLGAAREARFGRVSCPQQMSISVPVQSCADCRLLTWSDNDRRRGTECSTEPA